MSSVPDRPGHEISGHVYSMDEGVETDLKLGDSVIVYPALYCNSCTVCKKGYNTFCNGNSLIIIGIRQDGGCVFWLIPNKMTEPPPFPFVQSHGKRAMQSLTTTQTLQLACFSSRSESFVSNKNAAKIWSLNWVSRGSDVILAFIQSRMPNDFDKYYHFTSISISRSC